MAEIEEGGVAAEAPSPVRLETERLVLTLPPPSAAARVLAYRRENAAHFAPWDPPAPPGADTEEHWRARLARHRAEHAAGMSCRLFLARREAEEGPVIGQVSLNEIVRGPLQACFLGYGIARAAEGQGLMTEAVRAVLRHAFEALRLHRVGANYVPHNQRSGRLLRRLGFAVEGYARDYLYIDGAWRDHVLTALYDPAGRPPPTPARPS